MQNLLDIHRFGDYAGDPISDAALESCVAQAGKLLKHTARLLGQDAGEKK